jgi:hypothetical protein
VVNVQKQFDIFNGRIKLLRFEENKTLRDKRDIIQKKLRDRLPTVFEGHEETCPSYVFADQGSYKMGTGVKPLLGNQYDIDQGMHFAIASDDYADPVILKMRVHEALDGHTKEVRIRNSCVTVFYQEDGEQTFHVDLAIYADGSLDEDGKPKLAKGKTNSAEQYRFWEVSQPKELADTIYNAFSEREERQQFRRLVRYLKRWRDLKFTDGGNSAPIGLVLTLLAMEMMPTFGFDGKPRDLDALSGTVDRILSQFHYSLHGTELEWAERLIVSLPVEPGGDLLANMTNLQMGVFKERLTTLKVALDEARATIDTRTACLALQRQFGDDFPVPDSKETAKKNVPAIVSSSSNAQ